MMSTKDRILDRLIDSLKIKEAKKIVDKKRTPWMMSVEVMISALRMMTTDRPGTSRV